VPIPGEFISESPNWWGVLSTPKQATYKYGAAWLVKPLPADVFTDIVDLFCDSQPARDRFKAWADANGLKLEPFGDALRPVVEAVTNG
jgi:hypothetical protein